MDQQLTNIPLFKGVDATQLESDLSQIFYQRKSFSKDSLVISQGEECNRLMILTEGKVKGEMTGPTGKSLKIEDMEAPSVLASAFIFGRKNFFPVNIVAINDVRFMVIPKAELLKLFQINEQILQNFLSMISSRAQFLSEKLRFHSFKALKAKLAFYLMNEAEKNRSFKLKHSQNELAELFGVARPSVGRTFLQLQEEGIIDIRYKQVEIINPSQLAMACNE
jgi:CRP-like cAMP-binding protein